MQAASSIQVIQVTDKSARLATLARVTCIASAHGVLAPHHYSQEEISQALLAQFLDDPQLQPVLAKLHEATGVRSRNLAVPIEHYEKLDGFGTANDIFLDVGVELAEQAVTGALRDADLAPEDVDLIAFVTVTGLAVPGIEARLIPKLGMRPDVRRLPMVGMGCVAGAAGVARLHDMLSGNPDAVAVLVSVELCSLTLQRDDFSMANLVGSGLFGDGAAAVVLVGEARAAELGLIGPYVVSSRSSLYPASERLMGWDITNNGFKIVLSPEVAAVVEDNIGGDATAFLGQHDLTVADIMRWVSHPGGPKILRAVERSLDLPDDALAVTWESLARIGNLSSASVLHVLSDTLDRHPPGTGQPAMMLAMGPGFCSELVLLRW